MERSKLFDVARAKDDASVEAKLWREVGQHLELEESIRRIAAILAEHVPVDALLVRRVDHDPLRFTTVAIGITGGGTQDWPSKTEVPEGVARETARWLGKRDVTMLGDNPLTRTLAPSGVTGALLGAPLVVRGEPVGVVLAVPRDRAKVTPQHLGIFALALGPLEVAFENDQRIQELARMREALEADRDALLSRLQRQDISEVIIGEGGGLRAVMERVEQVAKTDVPVLVLGDTGSGKEVIARAIHARSRRRTGPVVRVNCGAIPTELVDSELFGHEKGSFTGAVGMRKGWFERADGGTLFLDEVGEFPLAAQVRLLRVLQDGTLERIGGQQTIHVDVRIVAATHRHLEAMVAEGTFREDLWYRLSVFPIRLPALRERLQDLAGLAAHFAERAGKRLGGKGLALTPGDIELLSGYGWPGNVRELASVIERAAILGNGKRLEIASALGPVGPAPRAQAMAAAPADKTSVVTLDEAMGEHIRRALIATHGRVEGTFGAAKLLGINPHTLRARMRKLGVDWAQFRRE